MIGQTLGHYRVAEKLGAGGMGEVYRATDPKLGRDVALKVLPPAVAREPERLARFEREARVLASLNHPNIAAIYGFEQAGGVPFLVLEYVPGPTLGERLASGKSPVPEILQICRKIAEALEEAHEKGIIHRDLKPANVKVTPEGKVKVLDFGLAKAFIEDAPEGDASKSPTMSVMATRAGVILGTAAYMSPEQARSKPLDKRTDIWSFGCVLYEALAGKAAFGGETISHVLVAVLERDPDWQALPAAVPGRIRDLMRRCLQRDRDRRLRDIADARLEIEEALAEPSATATTASMFAPALPAASERRPWVWAAVAGIASLAIGLLTAALYFRHEPPEPPAAVRFTIPPPEKASFLPLMGPMISPDGRRLAAVVSVSGGDNQIWVRSLDNVAGQSLAGTAGAIYVFWSPDSRNLLFFAGGKLKRINANGGPAQTVGDAPLGQGATWNRDGVIVFTPNILDPLYEVSVAGGTPKQVTSLDKDRKEASHRWPYFLPDGRRFLYFARSAQPENNAIYAGSLDGKVKKRLLAVDSSVGYAPAPDGKSGHVLFVREGTLLAQRLQEDRLELDGEPFPVVEQVEFTALNSRAAFSVSSNGVLAYLTGTGAQEQRQLIWVDRSGKTLERVGPTGPYYDLKLSPDLKRVAFSRLDAQTRGRDLWVLEFARGATTRFTFHAAHDLYPIWSPDGKRVAWGTTRDGPTNLYQRVASGDGNEEPLLKTHYVKYPWDWSPDGRFLLYSEIGEGKTTFNLWVAPVSGDRKPLLVVQSDFPKHQGQFSPDGKWIAYTSFEPGSNQVYVQRFAESGSADQAPGGRWQISTAGGSHPRWRRDGRELFYLAPDRRLMAVEVKTGATFEVGAPRALFAADVSAPGAVGTPGLLAYQYDVSADGQRFLMNALLEAAPASPIEVVLNWVRSNPPLR